MKIALITAERLPKPDLDLDILVERCRARGLDATPLAWTADVDWAAMDAVVLRTPWDYVHHPAGFLAWVHRVAGVTRLLNGADTIAWNIHKRYLVELIRRGVPTVPTTLLTQGDEAGLEALRAHGHAVVVAKPAVGIGAHGALRAPASSADMRAHVEAALGQGDVLLQPFVPSVEQDGETSLVFFAGEFSHAVRKQPKAGDYRVQDHHGGTLHDCTPSEVQRNVARAALACAPTVPTYARVDLVQGDQGPLVMELELIEPELFLRRDEASADRLIAAILAASGGSG